MKYIGLELNDNKILICSNYKKNIITEEINIKIDKKDNNTKNILKQLLKSYDKLYFTKTIIVGIHGFNSNTTIKNIKDIFKELRFKNIYIIDSLKIKTLGANVDLSNPNGIMIINVDNYIEMEIISLYQTVISSNIEIKNINNKVKTKTIIKDIEKEINRILKLVSSEYYININKKGIILMGNNPIKEDIYKYLDNKLNLFIFDLEDSLDYILNGFQIIFNNIKIIETTK